MTHVSHMLLTTFSCSELFITVQTKFAKLDSLCNICKQAFEVGETLDIKDGKVMFLTHMVEVLLDSIAFQVAEKTNAQ